MIYAVLKLNSKIKALKTLIPRNGLLITHVIFLILDTVCQLIYYLHQHKYFNLGCFTDSSTVLACNSVGDNMVFWNGAWRLSDAASYILILYMMHKFLVPSEKIDVLSETSWLVSS